jgi:hypothetical protein
MTRTERADHQRGIDDYHAGREPPRISSKHYDLGRQDAAERDYARRWPLEYRALLERICRRKAPQA